jgi:hypothetical protein
MGYAHLPALKGYTSQAQYDALKSIEETKSLKALVFSGSSSRTLGALVRSAWINTFTYTENEINYEGWCVTDAGKHAMSIFAERLRLQQIEEDKQTERYKAYHKCLRDAYFLESGTAARREELRLEWQKLTDEIAEAKRGVEIAARFISRADQQMAIRSVVQEVRNLTNVSEGESK